MSEVTGLDQRSRVLHRRTWVGAGAALAAVAVVALVVWLSVSVTVSQVNAVRVFPTADGVFVGSRRAPTTIDVFAEPICAPCARLTNASATEIRKAVQDKKIAVRYHLLNTFDRKSASGDYSTRVVAASICVAASGDPDRYQAFYAALFASDFQPKWKPKDSAGRGDATDSSNADLAQLAQKTGISATVTNCIANGQRVPAAKKQASNARASLKRATGIALVPMIFMGTREVDYSSAGWTDNLR